MQDPFLSSFLEHLPEDPRDYSSHYDCHVDLPSIREQIVRGQESQEPYTGEERGANMLVLDIHSHHDCKHTQYIEYLAPVINKGLDHECKQIAFIPGQSISIITYSDTDI